jgi:hypothetical protein
MLDIPSHSLNEGSPQEPPPCCKYCNAPLTFLGRLPRFQCKPSVRVYRCYECKAVDTEEI